jgi:hypothetical protein
MMIMIIIIIIKDNVNNVNNIAFSSCLCVCDEVWQDMLRNPSLANGLQRLYLAWRNTFRGGGFTNFIFKQKHEAISSISLVWRHSTSHIVEIAYGIYAYYNS